MLEEVRSVVAQALQMQGRVGDWHAGTALLGSVPELDSMAVVTVITALEEHYGFVVDDDEISAETFATLGSLVTFVEQKAGP